MRCVSLTIAPCARRAARSRRIAAFSSGVEMVEEMRRRDDVDGAVAERKLFRIADDAHRARAMRAYSRCSILKSTPIVSDVRRQRIEQSAVPAPRSTTIVAAGAKRRSSAQIRSRSAGPAVEAAQVAQRALHVLARRVVLVEQLLGDDAFHGTSMNVVRHGTRSTLSCAIGVFASSKTSITYDPGRMRTAVSRMSSFDAEELVCPAARRLYLHESRRIVICGDESTPTISPASPAGCPFFGHATCRGNRRAAATSISLTTVASSTSKLNLGRRHAGASVSRRRRVRHRPASSDARAVDRRAILGGEETDDERAHGSID